MLPLGLLTLPTASAQFSGRITGSVVDASGAAVPDAAVELYIAGGQKPLLSVKTSADGLYNFIGLRPTEYDISVNAPGFVKATIRGIIVDPAREIAVPQFKLAISTLSQSVEVSSQGQLVDTSSAEIAGTISAEEIRNLPILDRDVISILQTQPGVVFNGNTTTVIDGLRTSYSNITVDGINVQDNYIRDNALDYTPNKLLIGQVQEVTVVSSNANSAASGGATQTAISTPSGTNVFHGEALWNNRNNRFSANDWFSNQSGVAKPFLNQNQMGGSLGGPMRKDKLFFYLNYEAIRTRSQNPTVTQILTGPARSGIFRYFDIAGSPRQVDLLALRGITIDPAMQGILDQVPGPEFINSGLAGDGLNTLGYRFNRRDNGTRDHVTTRLDYSLSTKQTLSASYLWNRYDSDRPDTSNDYSVVPKVFNPTHANFLVTSWRWTPSARLTNDLRAGFNLTYGYFFSSQDYGKYYFTGTVFSNPVNRFESQGRTTNTFVLSDDAAYQINEHYLQFGFYGQNVRIRSYDAVGIVPSYGLGLGAGQRQLTRTELPGIGNTDLATASSLLATLGGYLDSYHQTLNVTSRTSGFVPGAPYVRHFLLNHYDLYFQDKWKILPRLTVTLGVRWQIPGVADERDSLALQPVIQGSLVQTLLSDATLDFAGKSAGRPWYRRHWRSFSPNIGFSWDPFGDGKTSVRGAYSVHRVNDQDILAAENMLISANGGLRQDSTDVGLTGRAVNGVPPIFIPTYKIPRTASENYFIDPTSVIGSVDPNLNRPYVQQYSFGIQRDIKGTVLEARYVGNHVVGAYRAFDYNQVEVRDNGFLDDFRRAQNNGFLARGLTGVFNPNYNPTIPGSQELTIFPRLARRGSLNDGNVLYYLETGQPGELATYYQLTGLNGTFNFFPNPNALAADVLTNYSHSSYNSLQVVARRRMRSGLSFEGNYTFSKVLSDSDGDLQARFQAFLDMRNPKLERSRANFDLTHMIKGHGFYDLPFGAGRRFSSGRLVNHLIGGWRLGSTMVWQSGAPLSILSGRGTLNRTSRSYYNTAVTPLNMSQLRELLKFRMTGFGPAFIADSAFNPSDGSGVSLDGEPPFPGQVFYNPTAGNLGTLQRRAFSGPWTFNIDLSVMKSVKVTEAHLLQLRLDAYNALNHATFWVGDQYINSPQFGAVGYMFYPPRVLQMGLLFKF
jgi:hypothetical protein